MCKNCDYENILGAQGLEPTGNRLRILEAIGNNNYPLTAVDIFHIVERMHSINRVTVYRILDLLVEKKILERLNVGSRAAYYGLAPNENHVPHPHFFCIRCGQMDCLNAESIAINDDSLRKSFPGEIKKVEVRVDGICKNCLKLEVN